MKLDKNRIVLARDGLLNHFNIDGIDYQLEYIDPEKPQRSWSPNGFIFKLRNMQEDEIERIIKICNVFRSTRDPWYRQRLKRFEREIEALKKVKDAGLNHHVIEYYNSGEFPIDGKTFDYYTMELASTDLTGFLRNEEIEMPERYRMCAEVMKCLESLHSIGIYHRDIKPGNFLIVDDTWKIADLGLVVHRDEDTSLIDKMTERIGPGGFLSPEAVNKWLSIKRDEGSITIDDKSDVFQIGKVIGFILFGEVLTGVIEPADLSEDDANCKLTTLLTASMQYAKERRSDLDTLRRGFVEAFGREFAFS